MLSQCLYQLVSMPECCLFYILDFQLDDEFELHRNVFDVSERHPTFFDMREREAVAN